MTLSVLSFSYKTTPIELRERLAFSSEQLPRIMAEVRDKCDLAEVMLLSTCNRVEFYYTQKSDSTSSVREWLRNKMESLGDLVDQAAVEMEGKPALFHLFRVAASLESMVVGEPQILGQIKEAYHLAGQEKMTGPVLTGLMPKVLKAAKKVRTETQIARFPVSISYAAVELARKIFGDLKEKTVMVVGAGEMAELTITHLIESGIQRLLITNRTFSGAVSLAEKFQGSAFRFEEMGHYLHQADIVISSTGAPKAIITREMAKTAVKKRKGEPMFFIDIAVPRDIEAEVNELSDVYCYDIDDLKAVVDTNKQEREREAREAHQIIENEVEHYEKWFDSLSVVPVVKALRNHFIEVGEQELQKSMTRFSHLPLKEQGEVRKLVRSVLNKILHGPSTQLKQLSEEDNPKLYTEVLASLFSLNPQMVEEEEPPSSNGKVVHLHLKKKTRSDQN